MTREVLQQALEALEMFGRGEVGGPPLTVLVHDLRAALAEPLTDTDFINRGCRYTTDLMAQPEQYSDIVSDGGLDPRNKPEPVAWMHKIDCDPDDRNDFMAYYKRTPGYCTPLYASPPKRQPLTDEQMANLFFNTVGKPMHSTTYEQYTSYARALELHHDIGDKT